MWRSWSDGKLELAGSFVCRPGWRPTADSPLQYANRDSLNASAPSLLGYSLKIEGFMDQVIELFTVVGLGVALMLPLANPLTSVTLLLSLGRTLSIQE